MRKPASARNVEHRRLNDRLAGPDLPLQLTRRQVLALMGTGAVALLASACAPAAPAPTSAPAKPTEAPKPAASPVASPASSPAAVAPAAAAPAAGRYPSRPVDFIVPWGAGGGADQLARTVGPLVEKSLGVPLPVQNVAGATGGTGMAKLLAAQPDGHSILIYIADSHAVVASEQAAWKNEDLSPIVRLMKAPSFVFVRPDDSRFQTWRDLEKLAKEQPNAIKVATVGRNSVDELSLTFVMKQGGYSLNLVPYANPGERYNSLISSQVDALYEQAGDVSQNIEGKQMRPILIFNEERMPQFPEAATSKELGYNIFLPQFRGVVARAGTDPAIIKTLADSFESATKTPEWARFAESQYVTADSFMGSAAFAEALKSDLDVMVQIKKQFGI